MVRRQLQILKPVSHRSKVGAWQALGSLRALGKREVTTYNNNQVNVKLDYNVTKEQ